MVDGAAVRLCTVLKTPVVTFEPPLSGLLFDTASRYAFTLLPVMLMVLCVPVFSQPFGDGTVPTGVTGGGR